MKNLFAAILLTLTGIIFGYFMVLLLPIIFVTWLEGKMIPALKPHEPVAAEKEAITSGWMWKKDDGSFTWTWYP